MLTTSAYLFTCVSGTSVFLFRQSILSATGAKSKFAAIILFSLAVESIVTFIEFGASEWLLWG